MQTVTSWTGDRDRRDRIGLGGLNFAGDPHRSPGGGHCYNAESCLGCGEGGGWPLPPGCLCRAVKNNRPEPKISANFRKLCPHRPPVIRLLSVLRGGSFGLRGQHAGGVAARHLRPHAGGTLWVCLQMTAGPLFIPNRLRAVETASPQCHKPIRQRQLCSYLPDVTALHEFSTSWIVSPAPGPARRLTRPTPVRPC